MRCRSIRSCKFFGAMASALIIACSDSTAPIASRIPGTYEFTTVLDSFRYVTSCTPTNNGPSCTGATVAAGPSRIYGTFTVGDTIPGTWDAYQFPVSSIVTAGKMRRPSSPFNSVEPKPGR